MLTPPLLPGLICLAVPLVAQVWGKRVMLWTSGIMAVPLLLGVALVPLYEWEYNACYERNVVAEVPDFGACDSAGDFMIYVIAVRSGLLLLVLAVSTLIALAVLTYRQRRRGMDGAR